jgi:hypothetical protein
MPLVSSNLPDYLHDLWSHSSENLNVEEKGLLERLLIKYKDVFSKSPDDLGRTDRIKQVRLKYNWRGSQQCSWIELGTPFEIYLLSNTLYQCYLFVKVVVDNQSQNEGSIQNVNGTELRTHGCVDLELLIADTLFHHQFIIIYYTTNNRNVFLSVYVVDGLYNSYVTDMLYTWDFHR